MIQIEIKKFFTKQSLEPSIEVNIQGEIHRLLEKKYTESMEEILCSETLIDKKEVKTFNAYTRRNRHLSERTGIPNYSLCCGRLSQDYFEPLLGDKQPSSALKRIVPSTTTEGYRSFYDANAAQEQLCDDLLIFEKYSKFDVGSLEALQIREAIIEDINKATPAAMFEGSLDEWSATLKDGTQQQIEEFQDEMEQVGYKIETFQIDNLNKELHSLVDQKTLNDVHERLMLRY